jgi:hypothetical protein
MLHVNVNSVTANTDSTFDVVLECDGTLVQCAGVAWLDEQDNDYMLGLFEEWHDLALEGEEGYTILD